MEQLDILALRERFVQQNIVLCFNGPFSSMLIQETGRALRNYMGRLSESPSAVMDVFSVYIETTQNIHKYALAQNFDERQATATVVVSRADSGTYIVSVGNIVKKTDGEVLSERIRSLAKMEKYELKAAYKAQLRQPRHSAGAGLGLIAVARKAREPLKASLKSLDKDYAFFSLRVVI
ncbi:MAG: biofilm regulation protein kinase SiaB [Methylohalobius sp. ZOD2]|nr:biofilm regulation protein kinase SiaB [Methylothermaceae bacterium]